jgi:hypothetical protein
LALLIPLILWKYQQNKVIIHQQQSQHMVLNTENQWFLIDGADNQVIEAQLQDFWLMPAFVAIRLATESAPFCCLVLRKNFTAAAYSRLVVGLNTGNNDTNEFRSKNS